MRLRGLTLAAGLLVLTVQLSAGELTDSERQRLVSHLQMTSSWFLDEVGNLSSAQLEFRRAPGSWNILEVVDHLAVVGQIYWDDLQRALKTSMNGRSLSNYDANILWYGIDRTYRETAIPSENPRKPVPDLQTSLAAYRKHHARLLQYVKTTKDDLRNHYVERQRSDAYQWALLISTHEQRHILQIREIKADPKYPKR
jgi:hypothetical protein